MLRQHQRDLAELCKRIKGGEPITDIIVSVTPGGGKSLLPVIMAHELIPSFADKICWIVPRNNLQLQGEKSFKGHVATSMYGHAQEIRISTNDYDPSRGKVGFVTTYQAVGIDPRSVADELRRFRYILFLDEPHHVAIDGTWAIALRPIVDLAKLKVYASGTLERHDRKMIAFLPYISVDNGLQVDLTPTRNRHVITYSRRDALRENAIVPLVFRVFDGPTEFVDADGNMKNVGSLEEEETSRDALFTALSTKFAYDMLTECVNEWTDHKRHVFKKAKLLVVAPGIKLAKKYHEWLNRQSITALIATSDDDKEAQESIGRFRGDVEFCQGKSEVDVLVTVGMAYEGLDCECITHVACLTYIRSRPWLEQCFDRADRVSAGKLQAFIYGPSDAMFLEAIEKIKNDQLAISRELEIGIGNSSNGGNSGGPIPDIMPIFGTAERQRTMDLSGGELSYEQTAEVLKGMEEFGLKGDPLSVVKFMAKYGMTLPFTEPLAQPKLIEASRLTPSQREDAMKSQIETYVRSVSYRTGIPFHQLNYELVASFNKRRSAMTESELAAVWAYLQKRYPRDESNDPT